MRCQCDGCGQDILIAVVRWLDEHGHECEKTVVADPHEHEPRARCYRCANIEARGHHRGTCERCGGTGYVGSKRPDHRMLAVDVAWSDEGHSRVIGPKTPRRRGECLYELHQCLQPAENSVMVAA